MSAERMDWHAGALIRDKDGKPTWRYRVGPFQVAFAQSGLSIHEVEVRAGWDHGYFSRVIGLRSHPCGRHSPVTGELYPGNFRRSLSYENAVKVARALDLDLVEWEL